MKVLVTGANGQLGTDLVSDLSAIHEVFGLGRQQLDVTNYEQVYDVMGSLKPDVVIHAAAYTSVDLAETDKDRSYAINAFGSRNVAVAAERIGAKICFISTDYVFDGLGNVPYGEFDQTNPINFYGKSKHAGEELVRTFSSKHFIVRTSWVYGVHGNNFAKTMLKIARDRDSLRVVDDQVGSPTYTRSLTRFLAELIITDKYGVYHASNAGACSWYEFAKAIFEEAGIQVSVQPCSTKEFPRPAPRPMYSVLDDLGIRLNGFSPMPQWRVALREFIEEYLEHNAQHMRQKLM